MGHRAGAKRKSKAPSRTATETRAQHLSCTPPRPTPCNGVGEKRSSSPPMESQAAGRNFINARTPSCAGRATETLCPAMLVATAIASIAVVATIVVVVAAVVHAAAMFVFIVAIVVATAIVAVAVAAVVNIVIVVADRQASPSSRPVSCSPSSRPNSSPPSSQCRRRRRRGQWRRRHHRGVVTGFVAKVVVAAAVVCRHLRALLLLQHRTGAIPSSPMYRHTC